MSKAPDYDYVSKLLIIGDSGVGKSSLLNRYTDDGFTCDSSFPTIGVDFKVRTVQVDDAVVKLHIWDTAGQERFRTITRSYYRGASNIVIVYDVTNKKSFENLHMWLSDIAQYASFNANCLLVANKSDMVHQREVGYEQGQFFADLHGMSFVETSAKTAANVEQAFLSIARMAANDNRRSVTADPSTIILRGPRVTLKSTRPTCCGGI